MVVAERAVLVAFFVMRHVLPEGPVALFAQECHFDGFRELVIWLPLPMAVCAIEPLTTARCTNCDLGIQYVLAFRTKCSDHLDECHE